MQPLIDRLHASQPETGRLHALWTIDAIGGTEARQAIRGALSDASPSLRLQAARSCGVHADRDALNALAALLVDRDPSVRREAAIALGAIGDNRAIAPLLTVLGDPDRFAAWSSRTAIRRLGYPDEAEMRTALLDPKRRENALNVADESWSVARRPGSDHSPSTDARSRDPGAHRRQPGGPVSQVSCLDGSVVGPRSAGTRAALEDRRLGRRGNG